MNGDPSRNGYLVPASAMKHRGETRLSWRFDAGEEKWIWCSYGARAVQLSKRLDDNATRCSVIYKESKQDGINYLYAECTMPFAASPPLEVDLAHTNTEHRGAPRSCSAKPAVATPAAPAAR